LLRQPKTKVTLRTPLDVKPLKMFLETVVTAVETPHETPSFEQLRTEKLVNHPHPLVMRRNIIPLVAKLIIAERETILSKESPAVTDVSKIAPFVKRAWPTNENTKKSANSPRVKKCSVVSVTK
jgi:hypothetical protein